VTGAEVISEKFCPEVRKSYPRSKIEVLDFQTEGKQFSLMTDNTIFCYTSRNKGSGVPFRIFQ